MPATRKQCRPEFKARVAIEALRRQRTQSQLGSQFKAHPAQIAKRRKAALELLPELVVDGPTRRARNGNAGKDALYEEIDRLQIELDWLKKPGLPTLLNRFNRNAVQLPLIRMAAFRNPDYCLHVSWNHA